MMQEVDTMEVVFRGREQVGHYARLVEREMTLIFYPDSPTMTALGIEESMMYLLNQIGWTSSHLMRRFNSYRRLTLEFLSSLTYLPNCGLELNRGVIPFRLFDIKYNYNIHEFADLLGLPNGVDAFTITKEELFEYQELDYFWSSISGNNFELDTMVSEDIHNLSIRYFHKIITHYLFEN